MYWVLYMLRKKSLCSFITVGCVFPVCILAMMINNMSIVMCDRQESNLGAQAGLTR